MAAEKTIVIDNDDYEYIRKVAFIRHVPINEVVKDMVLRYKEVIKEED